jgi:chromate transporter
MEAWALMGYAEIGALFLYFMMLAFIAVGGAPSILPEMHRYVVEVHGYMTSAQFAELYALAQAAPGPNVMYVPLLGWHIGGWLAALAALLAMMVPSMTLTLGLAHLYVAHPKAAVGIAIRRGLTPVVVGLIFASGWILMPAVNETWRGYLLTLVTVLLVLRTSLNPLWLLGAGATAGMLGLL